MVEQRPPEQERARTLAELAHRLTGWTVKGDPLPYDPRVFLKDASDAILALATAHQQSLERERALRDLLRRLSEWDMLYVSPEGKPVTADGPYWQAEIARALAANPSEEEAK